jgi:hypothetical protein
MSRAGSQATTPSSDVKGTWRQPQSPYHLRAALRLRALCVSAVAVSTPPPRTSPASSASSYPLCVRRSSAPECGVESARDVLVLLLPGHNDFGPPWGESYVTRKATAAINAANCLAKPLVKVQWGMKTHEVVPKYFADAANSDSTRRWLKELFVQCRDGVH